MPFVQHGENMNSDNEWKFIQQEVHAEKPTKKNLLKREVLFCMQILLSRKDVAIYRKMKEFYSAMN